MSVEVSVGADSDEWDRLVDRSAETTLFHRYGALQAQAEHAGATLYPLVGTVGEQAVGLFPVFAIRKGPFTTVFSPPPALRVAYLGPAHLDLSGMKQRKLERRRQSFVDACFSWLAAELAPVYGHVRLAGSYADLRPFLWNDCDVEPSYTYHVDLRADEDELLGRFSSDARRNVRDARDRPADAYTVEEGGPAAIDDIIEQVTARYEAQGVAYHVTPEFVHDLADALPDGSVRPYVLRVDGEFIGGILALADDDTVYRWQGGVRTDADTDIAINDVLDWHVMTDARARGATTYDLVGADNPRINRYKAKFNPDLVPFYSVEWGSPIATAAAHAYHRLRERK